MVKNLLPRSVGRFVPLAVFFLVLACVRAAGLAPLIFGISTEFLFFAMIVGGIALFHGKAFPITASGLLTVIIYKYSFIGGFSLPELLVHEWRILVNLLGLLLGFTILAKHFAESHAVGRLVHMLPSGWSGCFLLLAMVWLLSGFLDNIAAAVIGGTIALTAFQRKVHIGYIAAIVAASNAGGAWSVVGDTTTTLMWIAGVPARNVAHAAIGSFAALLVFGSIAALQQNRHHAFVRTTSDDRKPVDRRRLVIVGLILAGAIAANVGLDFPAVGVWAAILLGSLLRPTPWHELKHALGGSVFLTMLVLTASMMPVSELPPPSVSAAFLLGAVSSVFDNIPLTKLALQQGIYDWGMLAFTVGFGGSMLWFGSSAGVAITGLFPQARAVGPWLRHGWPVALAYLVGFLTLTLLWGWEPISIR